MTFICMVISALFLNSCTGGSSNRSGDSQVNSSQATNAAGDTLKASIDSPDGVRLIGTLWQSAETNSPGVLLLHQWQADRHSYDVFAKRMQAKGFNVLSIDGRGFGESTKKSDGTAIMAERSDEAVKAMLGDVGAAVDFLAKQKSVDSKRIGIVGASYGSSLAIIYAADHPEIPAVALLSPGLNYFGNMQTDPAMQRFGKRPLFMAAANDDPDSADAVLQLGKSLSDNEALKVAVLPKGGHGTALLKDDAFENVLESFLVESLQHPKTSK